MNDVFYSEYEAESGHRHSQGREGKMGLVSPSHSHDTEWEDMEHGRNKEEVMVSIEDHMDELPSAQKIPGEPLKALVSLLFLGVSWVANTSSLALAHEFVPSSAPLPDIVLDNITYQPWALDVSEILLMISLITAVVVVVFHKHRFVLVRRIWFFLGLLYFYRSKNHRIVITQIFKNFCRSITIFVTVLPKSDAGYQCTEKAGRENITALLIVNRVVTILSGGGLSINGKHVYCGDYIFSGHTVIFVMSYLCIKQCRFCSTLYVVRSNLLIIRYA